MNEAQLEILSEVAKVHEGRVSTHYERCWAWHAGCLARLLLDAEGNDANTED